MKDRNFKLLVSAGEPSGDLLASEVIREIKALEPDIEIFGMGGDRMLAAGCEILAPLPSVMGLGSPFSKIDVLGSALKVLISAANSRHPDAALLIDFPDFHILLARLLHPFDIPAFQFVSPQIWAWRPGRIETIKRLIKKTFAIFPFEEELYRKHDAPVEFVGHPACDRISRLPSQLEARKALNVPLDARIVALLPGTRQSVVEKHLPLFIETAVEINDRLPGTLFILSAPTSQLEQKYRSMVYELNRLRLWVRNEDGPMIIRVSDAAVISSGTATLEATLAGTPYAGVYLTSPFTYHLVRNLATIDHVLIANILARRSIVREFIQGEARPKEIAAEIENLLTDGDYRTRMLKDFSEVALLLGNPGAAGRVAASIVEFLQNATPRGWNDDE